MSKRTPSRGPRPASHNAGKGSRAAESAKLLPPHAGFDAVDDRWTTPERTCGCGVSIPAHKSKCPFCPERTGAE